MELGDLLIYLKSNLLNCCIYNLNSVIISRVLSILASQNRFKSPYDEIFNIKRVLGYLSLNISGTVEENCIGAAKIVILLIFLKL